MILLGFDPYLHAITIVSYLDNSLIRHSDFQPVKFDAVTGESFIILFVLLVYHLGVDLAYGPHPCY